MKNKIGKKLGFSFMEIFEGSAVMRFSKKVYNLMLSGFFGSLMTSYSRVQRSFGSGAVAKCTFGSDGGGEKWDRNIFSRARRAIICEIEQSRILSFVRGLIFNILSAYLKVYGFFFLYLGLSTAVINVIKRVILYDAFSMRNFIVSLILMFAALPMLLSKCTLGEAIHSSVLLRVPVYRVLGFSTEEVLQSSRGNVRSSGYFRGALAGAVLGCLSFYVAPVLICVAIAAVVFAVLVFYRPDIGLFGMVLISPVLSLVGTPTVFLSAIMVYTVLCAAVKVFLGRITVTLEIADIFVLIFMLMMGMGGIISVSRASLMPALVYACLMCGYFLTVILVRSREMLSRLHLTLITSGVIVSLYGFYQLFIGELETGTVDASQFAGISGRITSTFGNANMLGVFLIMVFPFAMALMFSGKTRTHRGYGFIACVMMGICTVFTWSRGAWLGLLIAAVVFMLLLSHKIVPLILPAGLLGVTFLWERLGGSGFFQTLLSRFTSIFTAGDTSSVYRISIWRGSFSIIAENWLSGIGIGGEAFQKVYARFAESGAEFAMHAHNMYLQITVEVGVIGLAVFLVGVFLCVQSGLEMIRFGSSRTAGEKAVCVAAVSGLAAAMLQGMTDHIWFNYRVFFTFWFVLAMLRVSASIGRKYNNS